MSNSEFSIKQNVEGEQSLAEKGKAAYERLQKSRTGELSSYDGFGGRVFQALIDQLENCSRENLKLLIRGLNLNSVKNGTLLFLIDPGRLAQELWTRTAQYGAEDFLPLLDFILGKMNQDGLPTVPSEFEKDVQAVRAWRKTFRDNTSQTILNKKGWVEFDTIFEDSSDVEGEQSLAEKGKAAYERLQKSRTGELSSYDGFGGRVFQALIDQLNYLFPEESAQLIKNLNLSVVKKYQMNFEGHPRALAVRLWSQTAQYGAEDFLPLLDFILGKMKQDGLNTVPSEFAKDVQAVRAWVKTFDSLGSS